MATHLVASHNAESLSYRAVAYESAIGLKWDCWPGGVAFCQLKGTVCFLVLSGFWGCPHSLAHSPSRRLHHGMSLTLVSQPRRPLPTAGQEA